MRIVVAEALGTAALVATACAAAVSPSELAPLTVPAVWGAILIACCRPGAPGPFLHPALTAAAWVAGRLHNRELALLLAAQAVGGLLGVLAGTRAAGLLSSVNPPGATAERAEPAVPVAALAVPAEAVVVAVLTLVALVSVASPSPTAGRIAVAGPGLPVALVAAAAVVLVGPVTGGAFNPATAAALAHTGVVPWDLAVAYVPAHLAGALAAALVVTRVRPVRRSLPAPAATGVPHPRQVADPVGHGS